MAEVERRYTPVPVEARKADDGRRRIGGYAAVFNRESRNLGGFIERVDPIAFNKSRGDDWPDVIARYNHDDNMLLGTTAAGTLRLSVDAYGLSYEVEPPQSRTDILELIERGDVRKSSFAFRTLEDDWTLTEQGFPLRTLVGAQLVDVAPVNVPAYPDTTSGLRSLAERVQAPLEEVRCLAEANDLRKLFVRTDRKTPKLDTPKTYGPAARMAILGKEQDPWA
ncbi:HK97 family phage prohead protease [Pseudonocardia parietis]|uniref:HK97 family phage prohead protease n=1 Tax=Pseudonocardia parietis TaxID=570936 RepID=A0ABS4W1Z9_9PSEU|nr:HK97 family phage prohead protease [Pseudonocardia parietis]MBP2370231.1 HK97 family phage prohead protease [Pseudonocardia parietis]